MGASAAVGVFTNRLGADLMDSGIRIMLRAFDRGAVSGARLATLGVGAVCGADSAWPDNAGSGVTVTGGVCIGCTESGIASPAVGSRRSPSGASATGGHDGIID